MNNLTVGEIITIFSNLINTNAVNAVFTLADQIFILNAALNYIYNFHKWSWTIRKEEYNIAATDVIETQYPILEVLKVYDTTQDYQRVNYFDKNIEGNYYRIGPKNRIEFPQNIENADITVIYRRLPQQYKPTTEDLAKIVDIDERFNSVLVNVMFVKSLGVFMGEAAGALVGLYKNEAVEELQRLAQMDTYKEGKLSLSPKR